MAAKKDPAPAVNVDKLGRAVLVTTSRRGVFFGYLTDESELDTLETTHKVNVERLRVVVRWKSTRGFVGLTNEGPNNECRISPAAGSRSTLLDVTAVVGVSDEARAKFEEGPWAR